ncbi:hypothetical protein PF010_g7251 [Phytophthora fragariae]|uniref:Uncharacterized protein n=1 Tax=Phytophthora fragariae TaxID=53985 RepID=A0A6A3K5Q9_9STRA|nr:hypothetical protein PF011_g13153 [Phytophthora fragariae]KAE9121063.1 hypothetical protein PF010_g7251 [Phytophthora fragariae]KAE9189920.1 hypothetical protein PF004_g22059 [Phytophthora fragariae]
MSRQSGGSQSVRDDTGLEGSGFSPEVATFEANERTPTTARSSQPETDATSVGGAGQNTATVTTEERGHTTGVQSPTAGEAEGTDTVVTTVPADELVESDTELLTHKGAPRRRTRQAEPQTGTVITSRPQTRAAKRLADDE